MNLVPRHCMFIPNTKTTETARCKRQCVPRGCKLKTHVQRKELRIEVMVSWIVYTLKNVVAP
jgi:hypothetical protein